jgi:DNA (cytosine-5)-methyltransferase 1
VIRTTEQPLTFGSLFAGIGGFDLGFEWAGMSCKWQVEIDDYANKVLTKHWPDVPKFRDVRAFPPGPDSPWLGAKWRQDFAVDAIIGGFPCQDISYAGHGAGLAGARSGLFFEAVRVVRQLRPKVVVLENVAALLTRGLDRVCGTLASIGYDAEWHCVSAASIGAPHIRNRIFILAHCQGDRWKQRQPNSRGGRQGTGEGPQYRPWSGGEALADSSHELRQKGKGVQPRYRDEAIRTDERNGFRRPNDDWWEVEPNVGRVADGVSARVDRLRGLGNAVVPQVAEVVARRVLELVQ